MQGRKQLGISLIAETSYLGFLIGVGRMASQVGALGIPGQS